MAKVQRTVNRQKKRRDAEVRARHEHQVEELEKDLENMGAKEQQRKGLFFLLSLWVA